MLSQSLSPLAEQMLVVAKMRVASKRSETVIHKAADAHYQSLFLAVMYGFLKGRKEYKSGQIDAPKVGAIVSTIRTSLLESLPPVLRKTLAAGGEAAIEMLPGMKAAGDMDSELKTAAKEPLKMRFDARSKEAVDWADKHAAELIDGITETTREDINNAIAQALENGTIDEAYDDILAAVGDPARAQLIARTETMRAVSEGQRLAWGQAIEEGLLPENAKRTWIATGDACPDCEALDGEVTTLDGEYPDPGGDGPPAHPACRCTEGIT